LMLVAARESPLCSFSVPSANINPIGSSLAP
jgi:hypothetical protein